MYEKISSKIKDIIYDQYGSGTGVLFGIPSSLQEEVRMVIKATLMNIRYLDQDEKDHINGDL